MTFSRVNVGGWALYETLTSAQMNQLDVNMTRALDGYAGGDYTPSSDLKVHGKIIGEDVAYRYFLYPMALGIPETAGHWTFDFSNYWWVSDGSGNVRELLFPLNRFLLDGIQLRNIVLYINQSGTLSGANRMAAELLRVQGAVSPTIVSIDKSYHPNDGGSGTANLYIASGIHDGGDGSATLTDSLKAWQTDFFVGGTVYNDTDGSSGVITANTNDDVTATLSGGTDNDWDDDDLFHIEMDLALITYGYEYYLKVYCENAAGNDYVMRMLLMYVETDYLVPQ